MAEEKDTGFRITDRRKFNPDGSPRDNVEESEPPAALSVEPSSTEAPAALPVEPSSTEAPESQANNVVSFPGEAARKREPEAPAAASAPAETAEPRAAQATDARAAQAKAAASAAEQAYNQTRGPQSPHLPEASFLALIDMFAAEAAMNLGMAQAPDGSRTPVDLEAARHWIDMLGMLEAKTRGNLTEEEAGVLENVLAYLRMQFVGASRK
jgi:Domain of unknown function (DUF1844)